MPLTLAFLSGSPRPGVPHFSRRLREVGFCCQAHPAFVIRTGAGTPATAEWRNLMLPVLNLRLAVAEIKNELWFDEGLPQNGLYRLPQEP
jgi:hypothetical protein